MVRAARHVEHKCDAVDLNLGCPQNIAKKGNYGAFLLPNPQLCEDIVSAMSRYCCTRIYALFIERRLVQALLPRRQLVGLALFVREWKRECRSHCRRTRFAKVICFGLMQPCCLCGNIFAVSFPRLVDRTRRGPNNSIAGEIPVACRGPSLPLFSCARNSVALSQHRELSVPVTVKIRAQENESDTLDLARRLEGAGAQLLTGTWW